MRDKIAVFKFGILNCGRIRDQMRGLNTARAKIFNYYSLK